MEKERLIYKFSCYGHPNIKATHVKTLEITKDDGLSERGDCIIGIKADWWSLPEEMTKELFAFAQREARRPGIKNLGLKRGWSPSFVTVKTFN